MNDRLSPPCAIRGFAFLMLVAVCAATASAFADESLEPPYELVINSVVDSALDDLLIQMQRLPAFAQPRKSGVEETGSRVGKPHTAPPRIVIAVDRSVGKTGQPTAAHELLDTLLLQSARQKFSQFEIVEASPAVLGRVQYILGARLAPVDTVVSAPRGAFRVDLLLQDFKTSQIVAQVSVRFTAQDVDLKPLWCCLTH